MASSAAACHNVCSCAAGGISLPRGKFNAGKVSTLACGLQVGTLRISLAPAKSKRRHGHMRYPQAMAGGDEKIESEESGIVSRERRTIQALEALGKGRKGKRQIDSDYDSDEDDLYYERPKKKKTWDEMSGQEKLLEAWLGEKGGLFWLNRLAWGAIILVIICWILFRFVGPQLGFYDLESPLVPRS